MNPGEGRDTSPFSLREKVARPQGGSDEGGRFPSPLPIIALATALLCGPARALPLYESDSSEVSLGGDVKSFFVTLFPYEHPLLFADTDPQGLGALDLRIKLSGTLGEHVSFKIHPQLTLISSAMGGGGGFSLAGGGPGGLPEALPLSKRWPTEPNATQSVAFRIDRFYLKVFAGPATITLGRQPVSFGTTFFFTPTDLVSPFSATTLDREYKPGVDAARVDLFFGESTTVTAVAAFTGAWDLPGLTFAARAGTTFGIWDLGLFAALSHEDRVFGLDAQGALGPVSLRAESTLTLPPDTETPFVRAAIGADHHFELGLDLSGELYLQSNGERDSLRYGAFMQSDRFVRGELWTVGQAYAALTLSGKPHPLLTLSLFGIVNLGDASALIGPGLSFSISDEASLDAGLYLGLGERPATTLVQPDPTDAPVLDMGSEFGPMPATAFLVLKAYL